MAHPPPCVIATLADIEATERAGPCVPDGVQCTLDLIRRGAQRAPDAPALSFFLRTPDHVRPVRWTHRQWLNAITRTANALRRLGVQRGDVVAYVLPNLPETHWIIWGAETAGVAFALNPLLDGTTLHGLMSAANASWLVTLAPTPGTTLWAEVSAVAARLPGLRGVIAVSPLGHLPGLAGKLMPAVARWRRPRRIGRVPVFDLHRELARERGDTLRFAPPELDDVASYFCTGGTTGLPKIAVRTHRTEVANAQQLAATFGPDVASPGGTVFCGLPLFHVNAQIGTGLAMFANAGHVLLGTPQGYRGEGLLSRFWEIVARHRISVFSGVPTVYAALLQYPHAAHDLSSLRFAVCGAAPMPVELFRRFQEQTGVRLLEGYGLTEAGCVSSLNPPGVENRVGSIGLRLPWQDMRVGVLDADGRWLRDAAVDEVGVIAVCGPNLFRGYLDAHHNRGLWIERPEPDGSVRRWLNTGDLGRQDGEGYFWLTGRTKELIIRGGHNIDPKGIEEAMAQHPAVALCAAVGRPDAHAGEVPVVYVQLRPDTSATQAELMAHACDRIGERAAQPKAVHLLPALPLTAVGKIFKPALSMREVESVVRDEAANAQVALLSLTVEQDARRGLLARARVPAAQQDALRTALGRYAFASDVSAA